MNEEYVEKETEFDVNEEDADPVIRCADCASRQSSSLRQRFAHTARGTHAADGAQPGCGGPLGILLRSTRLAGFSRPLHLSRAKHHEHGI